MIRKGKKEKYFLPNLTSHKKEGREGGEKEKQLSWPLIVGGSLIFNHYVTRNERLLVISRINQ